jgi:hypothetical protein
MFTECQQKHSKHIFLRKWENFLFHVINFFVKTSHTAGKVRNRESV